MTNPNNAIGTNGAYGGRTSVNAFNDNLAIYQGRGVLSGFAVSPNTGMSVAIGGDGTTRDVAIAEDNIGNKTTINNISESPISLTIAGAPASNSRIDAIVAYVDNPAQGSATEPDNPSACGLLDVQGSVSATPSQPDENAIRTAITADGASGTTAYYVVLGYITVANGTTDITSNMISKGNDAVISTNSVADSSITTSKLNDGAITPAKASFTAYSTTETVVGTWIDGRPLYRKVIKVDDPILDSVTNQPHGITNFNFGFVKQMFVARGDASREINYFYNTSEYCVSQINQTNITYRIPATTWSWSGIEYLIAIVEYTKTTD